VSCAGTSAFPVIWTAEWKQQIQPVIKAFLQHEATVNTRAYVRISITQFGQSSVPCQLQLQKVAGSAQAYQQNIVSEYSWQVSYEGSIPHGSLSIQEETSCGPNVDCKDYADQEAAADNTQGVGLGSGGLQKSDITNSKAGKPSSSDWVALFNKYDSPATVRMLQSFTQSCPSNNCQTGSLDTLLPFAFKNKATSYESYIQDLECAYVPDYSDDTGCSKGLSPVISYQQAFASIRGK